MKKYLLGLGVIALMTACSDKSDVYSEDNVIDYKHETFQTQFNAQFGTPAADQDWGFKKVSVDDLTEFHAAIVANQKALLAADDAEREAQAVEAATGARPNTMRKAAMSLYKEFYEDYIYLPDTVTTAESEAIYNLVNSGSFPKVSLTWTEYVAQTAYCGLTSTQYNNYRVCFGDEDSSTSGNQIQMGYLMKSDYVTYIYNGDCDNFMVIKKTSSYSKATGVVTKIDTISTDYVITELDNKYYLCLNCGYNGYTDLIMRVEPIYWKKASRIVAEDLGVGASDFDYNDIVFDGYVYKECFEDSLDLTYYLTLTIRAAGGTLPLYIGVLDWEAEVHGLFGKPTTTMINTNNGTASCPPVVYTRELTEAEYESLLTAERNPGKSDTLDMSKLPITVFYNDGTSATLKYNVGVAAEKIAVPYNFQWCDEREPIYTKYPKFTEWVKDKSVVWYE